jgi:hypothetical protein
MGGTLGNTSRRGIAMMRIRQSGPWVVYQHTIKGEAGPKVVCEQAEWEAMERDRPGLHTLIRAGIADEAEAERLARGTSAGEGR